jgi:hypothetical protein
VLRSSVLTPSSRSKSKRSKQPYRGWRLRLARLNLRLWRWKQQVRFECWCSAQDYAYHDPKIIFTVMKPQTFSTISVQWRNNVLMVMTGVIRSWRLSSWTNTCTSGMSVPCSQLGVKQWERDILLTCACVGFLLWLVANLVSSRERSGIRWGLSYTTLIQEREKAELHWIHSLVGIWKESGCSG